ncbi:MAG: MFS transporter [Saprospiraceae bacterium]|nr:MFS transporter [Saprospiraceae bacterium]
MPTTSAKISLYPVLLVNFIGMLGYSVILPFLVFLVEDFGGNGFIYGLLGAIYPAFQLIGAPLLGKWSDQIGRRRVLLISQIGTFLAWVLFIIAISAPVKKLLGVESNLLGTFTLSLPLVLLFMARALDGLTGGNVSVANAYLSDISNDTNRKANFGKMATSTSLGFIIGPVLAGFLGATSYEELLPVLAAALISLTAIFVIQRFLPESRPELVESNLKAFSVKKLFQIEHKECYAMENCPDTGLKAVLKMPHIPVLFGVYFLNFLGFSFFYACFPIFASQVMEWTSIQLGLFFTLNSGIMVLAQGPILSYLSAKVPDASLVITGSILISANFFLLTLQTDISVYLANVLMALGNGIMWPSFLSILAKSGTSKVQGTIQGYASSTGSLASIFGLVLGGILFNYVGASIFVVSGVILFLIFLVSFQLLQVERELKVSK